jgi:Low-density lipoprotein receptor repeat class B
MTTRATVFALMAIGGLAVSTGRAQSPGRIYFLELNGGGRVVSANTDGSDVTIVAKSQGSGPDGIAVDVAARHVYWTTMGAVNANDGTVERADLDGTNAVILVPSGGTFTPKQLKIDPRHGKIYWSDREGMRVMRANLDGSMVEVLVETASGDAARRDAQNWCVGIALDVDRGHVYWTQKGSGGNGRILRAGLELPKAETAAHRSDITVLFEGLPEPIDLDVDLSHRLIYWTDRGDPPRGNTVSRAPMDPPAGVSAAKRSDQQILFGDLKEGIGVSLDPAGGRMYVTDLGGTVYSAGLDGSDVRKILVGRGALTGIAFAPALK